MKKTKYQSPKYRIGDTIVYTDTCRSDDSEVINEYYVSKITAIEGLDFADDNCPVTHWSYYTERDTEDDCDSIDENYIIEKLK